MMKRCFLVGRKRGDAWRIVRILGKSSAWAISNKAAYCPIMFVSANVFSATKSRRGSGRW